MTALMEVSRFELREVRVAGYMAREHGGENPHPAGSLLSKTWQAGYLEAHTKASGCLIPEWIDHEKWFLLSANARWSGIQAVLLLLGDDGRPGAMAALRGMPTEAPAFLKKREWDRSANSRYSEAIAIEKHASLDVALETQEMHNRGEAIKSCVHIWSPHLSKLGHVCEKCGLVEDLRDG